MINKMVVTSIMKKLILRYRLNMDYKIEGLSLEKQTNFLINDIINDLYKKIDSSKIIVYEYNDDLISLIGYDVLKAIQSIKPFKLKIYGKKPKKTRKMIKAKESFISQRKVKKLIKDSKCFIISSFSPIYKVGNVKHISNKFDFQYDYRLMDRFTPDEISMSQKFYHIGYIKDYQKINGEKINVFDKELGNIQKRIDNVKSYLDWNEFKDYEVPACLMLWLDEDEEQNEQLLQKAEQFDGLVFYFNTSSFNIPPILKNITYNWMVKHTANRFNTEDYDSYNYLVYSAASHFYQYYWDKGCPNIKCEFSGNWPQEKRDKITLGRFGCQAEGGKNK